MPVISGIQLAIIGAIILIIGGLSATVWVQHANNRRLASELEITTQDRDRQVTAVKQLSDINQDQALQLSRLQVDAEKAAIVAQQVEQGRQSELAKLRSDLSSMKEKARANPEQVRPLGPIVRDALMAISTPPHVSGN